MTDVAISVENLSKAFAISHEQRGPRPRYKTLREDLIEMPKRLLSRLTRNGQMTRETFWALKDISFQISQGEVVGIIGRNGAGKSTLLKILSRITEPTRGEAKVYGRVGSLLEVGTGFHQELTGRENIFLNGAILGMTRAEVRKKFEEIVDFAEVEQFLDTPVKRYSSGMYVRLAFAVAAHLDPEILLVDEVLAVGDAEFQKKCLGKMEQAAKTGGRTILFVSHNMGAIAQLCANSLWLDAGSVRGSGSSPAVIAQYLTAHARRGEVVWPEGRANQDVDEFKLFGVRIRNGDGEVTSVLENKESFWVEIDYAISRSLSNIRVGFSLTSSAGLCLFETYDADHAEFRDRRTPGRYRTRCQIPGHLLSPSTYLISVNAGMPGVKHFSFAENALILDVEDTSVRGSMPVREGIIRPQFVWKQEVQNVQERSVAG